ncbi:14025_t:CDS:2 [Acaulospora morrowiae]|uniref:14025_t:CDS:1 n=1 Tax=Acaulospora morrowiae TaxID=94023 RepID=A0A9N8Z067_9GLOM|nr:14025_t:CDS:2 [Acaulospora morrowiae]
MNIAEEKWSIQQVQAPPSPHHTHSTITPQMNGMPTDNFMPSYQYEGQTTQSQMHPQQIVNPNSSANATDRKVIDNRPTFATSSFHATFQPGVPRKRRTDTMGFPQDAGPFFSQTHQHYNVYSMDRTMSYKLKIKSKVDRGFFLADNDWTCYRRNYFQISSAFSISHPSGETDAPCLIEVDGQFHSVTQFQLGITARVSNSDKKIELVQHTPKRDKGPQMVPAPKPIRPGGNLNLSSVGSNSNIVTFERIQFKTATANNGKRRAAQQYYVIMVDLFAQTDSGEQFRVASTTSAPLVVRGRSPGHYADNHDRYNPMAMNPAFPNDRHISYQGPNGPSMIQPDFSGAPFTGPYGQYPSFPFPPVMMAGGPSGQVPPFHPQHPHQQYMVQGISDSGENQNPEMYNNTSMDPNIVSGPHDQKMHQGQHGQMEMHMEGVAATSTPHSAFSKYVENFHMYDNAPNNGSSHHGSYHSDNEQANGRQARPAGSNNGHHSPPIEKSEQNSKSPSSNDVLGVNRYPPDESDGENW